MIIYLRDGKEILKKNIQSIDDSDDAIRLQR